MVLASVITVLIIDTGIAPIMGLDSVVHYTTTKPSAMHGTQVAYIATGKAQGDPLCNDVQFYSCDYQKSSLNDCLYYANSYNFDYINISLQGDEPDPFERAFIKTITNRGTIIVVAAGNQGVKDIKKQRHYPASYLYDEGMINYRVVSDTNLASGNQGPNIIQDRAVNWKVPIAENVFINSSGTSFAAPSYLHKLLKAQCKERDPKRKGLMCQKIN